MTIGCTTCKWHKDFPHIHGQSFTLERMCEHPDNITGKDQKYNVCGTGSRLPCCPLKMRTFKVTLTYTESFEVEAYDEESAKYEAVDEFGGEHFVCLDCEDFDKIEVEANE